jgi:hypothetical protein
MSAAPRPESQVAGDFLKSQTASEIVSRKRSSSGFSGEGTEAVLKRGAPRHFRGGTLLSSVARFPQGDVGGVGLACVVELD